MDNFVGKTGVQLRWSEKDYWCNNLVDLDNFNDLLTTENETLLYIKKGFLNLTTVALSDFENTVNVTYFYCQPPGDYKTWEMVQKEMYEKSLMEQFDTSEQ